MSGPATPSWFRLKAGTPLVAILVAMALIATSALFVALLVRDELDIRPAIEREADVRASLLTGRLDLALAVARTLDQVPPPLSPPATTPGSGPTRTADPIGQDTTEDEVRLSGEVVVPLPEPWTLRSRQPASAYLDDGEGGWFGVRVFEFDATQPASELLAEQLQGLVSRETFSRVETSGIETVLPFGDLTGFAAVGYSAVRTDPQGAVGVAGNAFALVRRDGLALVIATELTPPDEWESRIDEWTELFVGVASSFGHGPF
jgi:hypothetical protein